MARNCWYAFELKNGRKGIVNDWEICQSIIKTCPNNARYKKFATVGKAEKFLNRSLSLKTKGKGSRSISEPQTAVAYIDGSYNSAKRTWGYGIVLFPDGREDELNEYVGDGKQYCSARNVAGEIFGAIKAVKIAISMGFSRIELHYDYDGIEAWVKGTWKAKQELTQLYRKTMDELSSQITISFKKVTAHTGVMHNERADRLARSAAGIK